MMGWMYKSKTPYMDVTHTVIIIGMFVTLIYAIIMFARW